MTLNLNNLIFFSSNSFKNVMRFSGLLGSIFLVNLSVHTGCMYLECYHWSYLFGHNLICNACIDFSKMMKDYQFMLYGTATTSIALKINNYITEYSTKKAI